MTSLIFEAYGDLKVVASRGTQADLGRTGASWRIGQSIVSVFSQRGWSRCEWMHAHRACFLRKSAAKEIVNATGSSGGWAIN